MENIPYHSLFMRCDRVEESAFAAPAPGCRLIGYQPGMERVWADIQVDSGGFDGGRDKAAFYFRSEFLHRPQEAEKRILFLQDTQTGEYIGTCAAWMHEDTPILHWLAVKKAHAGRGHARALVTGVMLLHALFSTDRPVYLHTQPCSYKAIKLYSDFGFRLCKTDTFGQSPNEWAAGLTVLRQHMTPESYDRLTREMR